MGMSGGCSYLVVLQLDIGVVVVVMRDSNRRNSGRERFRILDCTPTIDRFSNRTRALSYRSTYRSLKSTGIELKCTDGVVMRASNRGKSGRERFGIPDSS